MDRRVLADVLPDSWYSGVGNTFGDPGSGDQWRNVTAGAHNDHLARRHGGRQIGVVPDIDLVVVTADPLLRQHGDGPWRLEKANLTPAADLITGLPAA